jgi:hypothetical protein
VFRLGLEVLKGVEVRRVGTSAGTVVLSALADTRESCGSGGRVKQNRASGAFFPAAGASSSSHCVNKIICEG